MWRVLYRLRLARAARLNDLRRGQRSFWRPLRSWQQVYEGSGRVWKQMNVVAFDYDVQRLLADTSTDSVSKKKALASTKCPSTGAG